METCCNPGLPGCDESACNALSCEKYCSMDNRCFKTDFLLPMTKKCCECDYCGRTHSSPVGKSHEYVAYACGTETLCYRPLDKMSHNFN